MTTHSKITCTSPNRLARTTTSCTTPARRSAPVRPRPRTALGGRSRRLTLIDCESSSPERLHNLPRLHPDLVRKSNPWPGQLAKSVATSHGLSVRNARSRNGVAGFFAGRASDAKSGRELACCEVDRLLSIFPPFAEIVRLLVIALGSRAVEGGLDGFLLERVFAPPRDIGVRVRSTSDRVKVRDFTRGGRKIRRYQGRAQDRIERSGDRPGPMRFLRTTPR